MWRTSEHVLWSGSNVVSGHVSPVSLWLYRWSQCTDVVSTSVFKVNSRMFKPLSGSTLRLMDKMVLDRVRG